jgi:hypothetical protein
MNASVSKAWYRHPMVWVVLAPPIGSVIAGVITMILILNHPDREVRTPHPATVVLHGSRANSIVPPAD